MFLLNFFYVFYLKSKCLNCHCAYVNCFFCVSSFSYVAVSGLTSPVRLALVNFFSLQTFYLLI